MFPELNVRTYVSGGRRKPGVFFFSLDATNPLAVAVARRVLQSALLHASIDPKRRAPGVKWRRHQL